MQYFFMGNRTLSSNLSCDSVIDGAFFSHPDFQVPEEKVCHHTCEYVVVPAHIFAYFIMVHAEFGLCFFKTLFNCPAKTTEPYKSFEPGAG